MTNQQVQPVFILPEGSQRQVGKDAQRTNIMAAKVVAETLVGLQGHVNKDNVKEEAVKLYVMYYDLITLPIDEVRKGNV